MYQVIIKGVKYVGSIKDLKELKEFARLRKITVTTDVQPYRPS